MNLIKPTRCRLARPTVQDHLFKLLEALINGSVDSEMYVARHYSCRRVAATTESRVRKSVHATIQDARKATQFNSDVLSWPWKNSRMLQDEHFESMNKSHLSFAQPLSLEEIDGEKPTYETEKWVESIIRRQAQCQRRNHACRHSCQQ